MKGKYEVIVGENEKTEKLREKNSVNLGGEEETTLFLSYNIFRKI